MMNEIVYGERFAFEWQAPMREKLVYQVSIYQRDYVGDVEQLKPQSPCLNISFGRMDDPELTPTKASEAVLSLLCTEEGDPFLSLFTTDPLRYRVQINVCRNINGGEVCVKLFVGYLVTGTASQLNAKPPYKVELSATDGLALLDNMPWLDENGERFGGVMSVANIVGNIIARIGGVTRWWGSAPIVAGGGDNTGVENTCLDAEVVYTALRDEPTCRDVLEAILSSFGVQLFQAYGTFEIRPVSALTRRRPASMTTQYGDFLPLYSDTDDGVGLSTKAIISVLPPLKKLTFTRPEPTTEAETPLPALLDAKRWRKLWTLRGRGRRLNEKLRLRGSELVLEGMTPDAESYTGFYQAIGRVAEQVPSGATAMVLNMRLANILSEAKSAQVALVVCDPRDDGYLGWADGSAGPSKVNITKQRIYVWSVSYDAWREINDGGSKRGIKQSVFLEGSTIVALPAAKNKVLFDLAAPDSYLDIVDVSIRTTIPPAGLLCVAILGEQGAYLSPIELREPTMTFEQDNAVVPDVIDGEILINAEGIGTEEYSQTFADCWTTPAGGTAFNAPLLNADGVTLLRGVIVPSLRNLIADNAGFELRALRSDVARQVEGEVYMPASVDMNSLWRDRDGRAYYTNYLRLIAHRGLWEVQLRELPTMRVALSDEYSTQMDMSRVIGLDTSAIFLGDDYCDVYRYDNQARRITRLLASADPIELNEGQRCACAVTYDGTDYALYAWDTTGKCISSIKNLKYLTPYESNISELALSARYDANVNTWTMAGTINNKATVVVLTGEGELISSEEYTDAQQLLPTNLVLIPNGYAYRPKNEPGVVVWHNNGLHLTGVQVSTQIIASVAAANEAMLVTTNLDGIYTVRPRYDTGIGLSTEELVIMSQAYKFIGMNNALVLFHNQLSGGARCYDARTGITHIITGAMAGTRAKMWISGEYVYGAYYSGSQRIIKSKRIL